MVIGKTLYVKDRKQWRAWLTKHHRTASDIWLVYYKKQSGKPRIPYNDAVEEALCYGWIDSTVKSIDANSFAQRFSPRRKFSPLSEMNKERVRRLVKAKKMTRFGLDAIQPYLATDIQSTRSPILEKFQLPPDILQTLKADAAVWKNFTKFPESYKHIRVGWIDGARNRPAEFRKRLAYFLKMTSQNKKFGMVR